MGVSVRFYQRPVYMEFLSAKESRPIHELRDFVRIEIPGMVANVVDTLAGEHHKRDHPVEWQQYLQDKETGEIREHQGTLLSDWPILNPAQVLEMKHYKFHTVEQVAGASDLQIEAIGMLAGMSPHSLREKAKAFLGRANEVKASEELARRDAEVKELRAMVEAMALELKKKGKKEAAEA